MSENRSKRKAETEVEDAVVVAKRAKTSPNPCLHPLHRLLLEYFYSDVIPIIHSYCPDAARCNILQPNFSCKNLRTTCRFLVDPREDFLYVYDRNNEFIKSFSKRTGAFCQEVRMRDGVSQVVQVGRALLIVAGDYQSWHMLDLRTWELSSKRSQNKLFGVMASDPDDNIVYFRSTSSGFKLLTLRCDTKEIVISCKPYFCADSFLFNELVVDPIHRRLALLDSHARAPPAAISAVIMQLDDDKKEPMVFENPLPPNDKSWFCEVVALYGNELFAVMQANRRHLSVFDLDKPQNSKNGRVLTFPAKIAGLQLDHNNRQTFVLMLDSIHVYDWW